MSGFESEEHEDVWRVLVGSDTLAQTPTVAEMLLYEESGTI